MTYMYMSAHSVVLQALGITTHELAHQATYDNTYEHLCLYSYCIRKLLCIGFVSIIGEKKSAQPEGSFPKDIQQTTQLAWRLLFSPPAKVEKKL